MFDEAEKESLSFLDYMIYRHWVAMLCWTDPLGTVLNMSANESVSGIGLKRFSFHFTSYSGTWSISNSCDQICHL